ncbi:MAG: phenylalanine--tRNA ligase subunit beta [Nitrospirota bacterium]|nr:phenylalanine--tRNA ligase subunit beta [Nitrospirota bacterium]
MRVPFEWLKEFVDISATPEEVADALTMTGLEVEGVESVMGDTVLVVNVTPNRPDCLSILGIAREISAVFNIPLKIPQNEVKGGTLLSDFSIEILNPELCNRYTGRLIKNVTISESPEWIKRRLEKCGIRAINNVVDITNYMLLEFGHPLHAFDADTLKDKKIKVAIAGMNNKMVTLDGIERNLPQEALLIWDNVKPIAIAGIMGGSETEVVYSTKDIFLESAYFEPFSIRRTSKRLNLISESSYRFERGTDIKFLENALNRAALMIGDIAGGTIYEIIDAYPVKYVSNPIEIRYEKINRILGTDLSPNEIREILQRLGMSVEDKGNVFVIYPPPHRRDIQKDSDVAEEIARIYGYNNIPARNPRSPLSSGRLNKKIINVQSIREAMRKAGFTEVINYSFMSPTSFDTIEIPENDRRRSTITIRNPLRQEESLLRTTLTPALIENFIYNLDRGIKDIRVFEVSKSFESIQSGLPLEELRLGGLLYSDKSPSLWRDDVHGYFITKGALESLFGELRINEYSFVPCSEPFLHMGQSSDIYVTDSHVGYLGILAPAVVERLDLKKQKPEVVLFEINLDLLFTLIPGYTKFAQIPKYPCVERDIALIVDENISASEIKEIIRKFPSELIEEVSIFDFYKGKNIQKGKKSLAFNIIYRSKTRTLTDDEIAEIHASLINHLLEKTGGELRK